MLLAKGAEQTKDLDFTTGYCTCPCHEHGDGRPDSHSDGVETAEISQGPRRSSTVDTTICRRITSPTHNLTPIRSSSHSDEEAIMHSDMAQGLGLHPVETSSTSPGNRPEVARILSNIAHKLGTASPDRFNDYEFKHGPATAFPQIPGEENRNPHLIQIEKQWGVNPEGDDALTPRGRRSRANSFNGSISGSAGISRSNSPQPPRSRPRASSLLGIPLTESPKASSESAFPPRSSAELEKTKTHGTFVTLHSAEGSPAIVLSSEDEPAEASGPGAVSSLPRDQRPP